MNLRCFLELPPSLLVHPLFDVRNSDIIVGVAIVRIKVDRLFVFSLMAECPTEKSVGLLMISAPTLSAATGFARRIPVYCLPIHPAPKSSLCIVQGKFILTCTKESEALDVAYV